ncbi:hypothetical protein RO3G_03680 [Rhizopus delemar RA 99-880]|uniref:Tc1-like transposase DDE domain-containing protein n=1 Tax=Rhizopus delemar (strain RA 99-880 / ATCC MYA-4621 / FGSC 9543 / NRRL 43880) TaxID=246409 RepID=I1BRZ5_RHIO9|nr:hypothetical protein RO3G_03680 [Rhizopus delemar RA 99-880]|eukprot:EIE78975.1 hypothetical protein RO3G_03680 [Rhizopus delemar RA 99-880]
MIWTPVKYKPSQVAQFISLMQNKNYKLSKATKETGIANNVKVTDDQSKFIEDYVEAHPTCIVKGIMEQLSANFGDLSVNESTVYRRITKKLEFTLIHTQPRIAARNSEDTKEQRRQFVEYLGDNNIDFKRKCIFIDESRFKKNMVHPVAWSKKGTPAEVEVQPEGINLSILGCMSVHRLIAPSQQVPKPNGRKKQNVAGTKRGLPHGANSSHFLLFIEEIAVLLNKLGLKKYVYCDGQCCDSQDT